MFAQPIGLALIKYKVLAQKLYKPKRSFSFCTNSQNGKAAVPEISDVYDFAIK